MLLICHLILLVAVSGTAEALAFGKRQKILDEKEQSEVFDSYRPEQMFLGGLEYVHASVEVFSLDGKTRPQRKSEHLSNFRGTILDFDDLETKEPLSNITTYGDMTFSSFKLMNIPLALNSSFLVPEDDNCATSPPNALIGSRAFGSTIPRIYVSNNCSSLPSSPDCSNDFPYFFKPIIMHIKLIGMVKGRVFMQIVAWELKGKEVVNHAGASVFFGGPGHVWAFPLTMAHWPGKFNVLEIKVWGPDRKDWPFSIDDLGVQFLDG